MPVRMDGVINRLDQDVFARIAHAVMRCVFDIHNEFGRFFDEKIYKRELQRRYPGARLEVPIEITFEDFRKHYFLDVLIEDGAVFELKAVEALAGRHRAQLMHYLLLADLPHGKLINMRTEHVQHEFVNTSLRLQDRTNFAVVENEWREIGEKPLRPWFEAFLRDVGTNLDLGLYEEALMHRLGGEEQVLQEVEVVSGGVFLGPQKFRLAAPTVALKVTAFDDLAPFEMHTRRLLAHTTLEALDWINITRQLVSFRTIRK
ncbi:MAG: GxxExxY protein [Blastocatellia bacterium]